MRGSTRNLGGIIPLEPRVQQDNDKANYAKWPKALLSLTIHGQGLGFRRVE
jgi:hypothetical protein